jgi:hypothetical protein
MKGLVATKQDVQQKAAQRKKEGQKMSLNPEDLRCPFCNKPVVLEAVVCPHCHASLLMDRFEKTMVNLPDDYELPDSDARVTCRLCGKTIPAGRIVCSDCARGGATQHGGAFMKKRTISPPVVKQVVVEQPQAPVTLTAAAFAFESSLLAEIRAIDSTNPPKAVISTSEGHLYFLVAGSILILGRESETSHVQTILQPGQQHVQSNYKISRQHCRVSIEDGGATVRDLSSNGTYVSGQLVPPEGVVSMQQGDILSLANVLDMRTTIFMMDDQICGLMLTRLNNSSENSYILAAGPVAFGADPSFPIRLTGPTDIRGVFYFDPACGQWSVKSTRGAGTTVEHTQLEVVEELTFDSDILLFSIIQ